MTIMRHIMTNLLSNHD
uniref:Uncharacterized protein n=1 Tax=Rhizophora mucronata TaxID=61149 RepID=A0A2P2QTU1_RHIMU